MDDTGEAATLPTVPHAQLQRPVGASANARRHVAHLPDQWQLGPLHLSGSLGLELLAPVDRLNMSNTGGLTVTSAGYFITQANNYNISMAKAADDSLNAWVHPNCSCGTMPGDSQCVAAAGATCPSTPCRPLNASTPFVPCESAVCGVIGNPTVPFPGTESLSDTGRALRLDSGLYLPVGARGPKNAGAI